MPRSPQSQPPYKQVADALRTAILRGDLKPGDRLDTEEKLSARFKLSRGTIRRGIELLRSEGLVVSQQGAGAFVRERPHVNMHQTGTNYRARRETGVSNYTAEAAAQGQRAKQKITEVVEVAAPTEVAERLGMADGAMVLVRRRLFLVDDQPMQKVDGYYPIDLVAGTPITEPRPIRGGVHAVLEDADGPVQRRIVQFIEDLDIRMPTPEEAELLNVPSGVPVARVLRTAYDTAGRSIEVLDSVIPCDRHMFRYVIDVP